MNVGVGVAKKTTLTIGLPTGGDRKSTLRIIRSGSTDPATPPLADTGWSVELWPGEYVLTVDSEDKPSPVAPLRLQTSEQVSFMSVAPTSARGDGPRTLQTWSDSAVSVDNPKKPDPPPGTSSRAAITPAYPGFVDSPIGPILRTLADAPSNGPRGGAYVEGNPPQVHALLIGIDEYPESAGQHGAIYRSLRGCVRDIEAVEEYLHGIDVPAERITKLVGPTEPEQRPTELPTYANIVAAWQRAIETARPGDILYVHYSGHGGRVSTWFPDIKCNSKLDEAIAPCDINDRHNGQYLRDVEIATLLARSAEKGVLTTLVLDSCHSGSATRGDEAQARQGACVDEFPRADRPGSSRVAKVDELAAIARQLENSPRGVEVTWQVDRDGEHQRNTVIAACRQNEAAYEYDADGHNRHGALTYFWLDTIRQRHAAMTYREAYRHVFARVQGVFTSQSPMLIGAGDRIVLGANTVAQARSIAVLGVDGDQVSLAAGASGMVGIGAQLALIPGNALLEVTELSAQPHIEVIEVGDASSVGRIIPGTGSGATIDLGWQAVIVRYPPRMQRMVRLLSTGATGPAADAFGELARAIDADPSKLIAVDKDASSSDYQVAIDRTDSGADAFAILDPAGHALPHILPQITVGAPDAIRWVTRRLVHLSRFHNVMNLTNDDPSSTLANKLSVTLHESINGACSPAPMPDKPTLKNGTPFFLRLRNRSMRPLYVVLFDLTSDWMIAPVDDGRELDPGATCDIQLYARLRPGHTRITDWLKVIATRSVVSFDWMALPSLDTTTRGPAPRAPENPFECLMKAMQDPTVRHRHVDRAMAPTRDWAEARVCLEVVA